MLRNHIFVAQPQIYCTTTIMFYNRIYFVYNNVVAQQLCCSTKIMSTTTRSLHNHISNVLQNKDIIIYHRCNLFQVACKLAEVHNKKTFQSEKIFGFMFQIIKNYTIKMCKF